MVVATCLKQLGSARSKNLRVPPLSESVLLCGVGIPRMILPPKVMMEWSKPGLSRMSRWYLSFSMICGVLLRGGLLWWWRWGFGFPVWPDRLGG